MMLSQIKTKAKQLHRYGTTFRHPLPDFLIIGAQRSGTTTLYRYLRQHPQLLFADRKELHYFDRFHKRPLWWYKSHFPREGRSPGVLAGEATPMYLFFPPAAQRVARYIPGARFIILLRNPVNRAYSHYQYTKGAGHETASTFEEAIKQESRRIATSLSVQQPYSPEVVQHSYVGRGLYLRQISRWLQYFREEQFLVLHSECFYQNPASTLQKICRFLHIPPFQFQTEPPANTQQYRPMRDKTSALLSRFYRPHNQALYRYLGRDFNW